MKRERVIVEFEGAREAKKVEETVKTGYVETAIESLIQWMAVEDDLADSYEELAKSDKDPASQKVFRQLHEESKSVSSKLAGLVRSMEALDAAQVHRIEMLADLK
jgi:rubrerythrin